MKQFLPDATNFDGIELKEQPVDWPVTKGICPLCKGYGNWNLELDAYGPGQHFQASCNQCNGYGWVGEADATCIHEYKEISQRECRERNIEHWGSCYHVYQCQKCPRVIAHDSSD